ncbi:MAG: hypothetical protein E6772_16555 [Dysgonomonas sp.]|nr:hypothetical protein [Dysgonomonas sp.]
MVVMYLDISVLNTSLQVVIGNATCSRDEGGFVFAYASSLFPNRCI